MGRPAPRCCGCGCDLGPGSIVVRLVTGYTICGRCEVLGPPCPHGRRGLEPCAPCRAQEQAELEALRAERTARTAAAAA